MDFISVDEGNRALKKNKNSNNGKLSNSSISKTGFTTKKFNKSNGGLIYVGHIPHGFYEDEMRSYFNQFGKVIATTVARSKKTGRSRGYGFVQFHDAEVAKIAAETMNNYLMYSKIIKCRYIPPDERRSKINKNVISANNYPRQKNRKIELLNRKKALSKLTQSTYLKRVKKKIEEFKTFFEENGIEFSFKINNESNQGRSNFTNSENEANDINGVLEIDESDKEISFKTPPQVKKVIKKSLNSTAAAHKEFTSNNLLTGRGIKNKSNTRKLQKEEKTKKKIKVTLSKKTKKNKETGGNKKASGNKKISENKKRGKKIRQKKAQK